MCQCLEKGAAKNLFARRSLRRVRRLPVFLGSDFEEFGFKLPQHTLQFELRNKFKASPAHFN